MNLIVTVGNANGENEELVFDVPPPITWIGIEIEDKSEDSKTGRITIMRHLFKDDGWRSIPVYVTDNDVVMCYADHDCEERTDPGWLPGRRVTLGDVVDAFVNHNIEKGGS